MAYKERTDTLRAWSLGELTHLSQELDLGY